jgi:hypothetical protein
MRFRGRNGTIAAYLYIRTYAYHVARHAATSCALGRVPGACAVVECVVRSAPPRRLCPYVGRAMFVRSFLSFIPLA